MDLRDIEGNQEGEAMTMRIVVKNEDATRTATVAEETFAIGSGTPIRIDKITLGPLDERVFHIHAAKRLIVLEDPEATVPR